MAIYLCQSRYPIHCIGPIRTRKPSLVIPCHIYSTVYIWEHLLYSAQTVLIEYSHKNWIHIPSVKVYFGANIVNSSDIQVLTKVDQDTTYKVQPRYLFEPSGIQIFRLWPLLISNNLHRQQYGICTYYGRSTCQKKKFIQTLLLDLLNLQGFQNSTSVCLKWRLTSTRKYRILVPPKVDPHTE